MHNSFQPHLEDGVLLRYIDGELPGRKARQVEKHLEACWQCRTEIEELKATMAECIHYRKNVLAAQLPAPLSPWQDLSRGFARVDDSLSTESFFMRLLRPPAAVRWTLAAATALALVCGVLYQLRETPSVQAATLLKKAVAAHASVAPKPLIHVRFRTGSQQFIRAIAQGRSPEALPVALAAQFEKARYDSADPLSAQAFEAWRDRQPDKRDEVATVSGAAFGARDCYRIRTATATGELASATLLLRTTDLIPVEGLLEFRNQDWIEFSEFEESPDRSNELNASNVEIPERPADPPSRLAAAPPRHSASISDELQVLSALHQIGADLGDPIQYSRSGDKVIVSGVGVPPQRRQLIQRTLESMPNVAVEFSEPVAAPLPVGSASASSVPSGNARALVPGSKLQTRLEEQLGGRAELERFSSQILDVDEGVMARAYALHDLAQRFPASSGSEMNAADRRVLAGIAHEHISALSITVNSLQRALTPVLTSLGGTAAHRAPVAESSWQNSAEDLFRSSRRVQVLLSVLLGVAPGQMSAELPSDVLNSLSELHSELDRCQRLLAQEGGG